jgi:hypothetical protein
MNTRRSDETGATRIVFSHQGFVEPASKASRSNAISILSKRKARPDRQNVGFRAGFIIVVKAHSAIQAEEVRVTRLSGMEAFDSVGPSSCDHLPTPIQHQVDFLFGLMVVWEVRAARSEVHEEEAGDNVPSGDLVACAAPIAHQ